MNWFYFSWWKFDCWRNYILLKKTILSLVDPGFLVHFCFGKTCLNIFSSEKCFIISENYFCLFCYIASLFIAWSQFLHYSNFQLSKPVINITFIWNAVVRNTKKPNHLHLHNSQATLNIHSHICMSVRPSVCRSPTPSIFGFPTGFRRFIYNIRNTTKYTKKQKKYYLIECVVKRVQNTNSDFNFTKLDNTKWLWNSPSQ